MSRRRNPRRSASLLARHFQPDSDSSSESEDNAFIQLMQAVLQQSRKHSRGESNKSNGRNKKNKKSHTKKNKVIETTRPVSEVIDLDLSEARDNISDTVKGTHQKNVENKIDTFFKSRNLLSDDDEDNLLTNRHAVSPKSSAVSKEFYILSDSDDDVPSTSTAELHNMVNNKESPKAKPNKDDELMEIVDRILETEDIPVETNSEPDNWNEFKTKTEEILGSVNALLGSFGGEKKKETVVELKPEETSVKAKPSCPICLEILDGNIVPGATICGHIFCLECIKRVVKTSKKCPTCRKKINVKQVHPLYL